MDKHQVNILYTAPTAIRALMAKGTAAVEGTSRQSLRLLGSVGEPINPEAWEWYSRTIGDNRCPIVDTWWQTETGGILITPLPGQPISSPAPPLVRFSACNRLSSITWAIFKMVSAKAIWCC
ncbi:AMP-binding protein [Plesiomonas shigelloides]|nr:AMP-binding protein [Plesiomonas shigelloides]